MESSEFDSFIARQKACSTEAERSDALKLLANYDKKPTSAQMNGLAVSIAPDTQITLKLGGPWKDLIGKAYTFEELIRDAYWDCGFDSKEEEAAHRAKKEKVLAWRIPLFEGSMFIADGERDIGRALRSYLEKIAGLPISIDEGGGFGGPWKYQHFHTSASLDSDPLAGPLFIELYGRILVVGGHDITSPDGARLAYRNVFELNPDTGRYAPDMRPLEGPLVAVIRTATLSNIPFPGMGVGFYE